MLAWPGRVRPSASGGTPRRSRSLRCNALSNNEKDAALSRLSPRLWPRARIARKSSLACSCMWYSRAEQNDSRCDLIRHPPHQVFPQRSREMSLHSSSTSIVEHPGAGETQLQGKWLALARIGWVTFTLLVLGVFFANL